MRICPQFYDDKDGWAIPVDNDGWYDGKCYEMCHGYDGTVICIVHPFTLGLRNICKKCWERVILGDKFSELDKELEGLMI